MYAIGIFKQSNITFCLLSIFAYHEKLHWNVDAYGEIVAKPSNDVAYCIVLHL